MIDRDVAVGGSVAVPHLSALGSAEVRGLIRVV